jgi:predicted dehydrogenase
MQPVRTALVGIGGIGGYHREIIHSLPEYDFVAAAEKYPDRQAEAMNVMQERGIPVFSDIWEMLDQVDVEAVTIATPHHFHAEYTLGCLERGLHVMCEKPVTIRVEDAYREVDLAKEKGLFVGVDFQYTGYPHSKRLKKFIVDGGLGELQAIIGVMAWKRLDEYYTREHWVGKRYCEDRACFDGVLMNQAVHLINSALQMGTRQPAHAVVQDMEAELYTVHDNIETEDLACLRARLDEATLLVYATTCNMDSPETTTLEIIGSEGTAGWEDGGTAWVKLNNGEELTFKATLDRDEIHRNFIRCIRGEAERLNAPLDEALKATLAIDGAYTSAGQIKKIGWEAVANIRELVDQAAEQRKLFSELGAEWAFKGNKIDMREYKTFDDSAM